jgi:cell wall-associated NlpC family hydrolase
MSAETVLRAAVIAEAKTWLRTPYHHMGRIKGGGVDCATLLAEVFARAGAVPPVDIGHYPPDWHLHRDLERYLAVIINVAHEIERPVPGDIVLYRWGRAFAHGAIITRPWPEEVIHAYAGARMVVLDRGDGGRLAGRDTKFFSVFSEAG